MFRSKRTALIALAAALIVAGGLTFIVPASAASTVPQRLLDQLANCRDAAQSARSAHQKAWAQDCIAAIQSAIDAFVAAHPTPTPTLTPTPAPTTSEPGSRFPDIANTGVPAGVALTPYTGTCTITVADTVIDAKTVTCSQLLIRASGVRITRSRITGSADPAVAVDSGDLAISDTTILTATDTTGLGDNNWVGLRLNISGGNRGANCDNHCTLTDSWLHGNRVSGSTHASGLRAGEFTTAIHNTLNCDAPADNCSADLTGYPDFSPTHDWTITNNLFVATHAGGSYFCSYGGASGDKPFSNSPSNAVNIKFVGNTYGRGQFGLCGGYPDSSPFADYDKSKPGFVFSGNHYDDGTPITV